MSIEVISLENFSAPSQADINSSTLSRPRHEVFHSFLSDDIKQDAATTTAHSKRLVSFLNNKPVLTTSLSTIWENTDGFVEQYICASALYLISVMSQCYSIRWKYICVNRRYFIGIFQCSTTVIYQFKYTITSTSCSVSLFFI